VMLSLSEDNGVTWSEPFRPHTDGTPTEHGFVTLFPDSYGVGVVWLDGRKMVNEFDAEDVTASGMTLRAGTFGADQLPIRESLVDDLTCDCCQTDVALTQQGPLVVYRDRTTAEIRDIYVSRRRNGEWQPGVPVSADDWDIAACPVNGPVIRARDNLVAVAWFTAAGDKPIVKAAWSKDAGRTFLEPVVLSDQTPLGHVSAVMLDSGEMVVGWQRKTGDGGAELVMRRAFADGWMGEEYTVPVTENVFSFSVPQLALRGDDLILAWTESADDTYTVETAILPVGTVPRIRRDAVREDPVAAIFERENVEATMVVESMDGMTRHAHNDGRAATRYSPASTFKIPNTLIALDLGIVDSADSPFTWDGVDRGVERWNRDQTLRTAYQVSCVWCYQEIARAAGADAYTTALTRMKYGNQNVGDEVDQFWLNGDLAISADEQIDFLRRLVFDGFGYDERHREILKDIMVAESGEGFTVYAKSGWTGPEPGVGWYVGYVEVDDETWLFAMNMHLVDAADATLRQELAMESLRALGII
jgi:beta-lactamase class D